ncbi:Putative 37S ribosomal protein S12 [Durusdinium trenchii]|uniref:Mitochondrial n=1 Tax=Durusdinium trenchii TaxID=1381693 RepID=A0ABP0R660_9DINO
MSHSELASPVEVLRVAVEPHGPCSLDAPLCLEIDFRTTLNIQGQWQLRFVADLVYHQKAVDLVLDSQESSANEASDQIHHVELKTAGLPLLGLPESALESLGILEARLAGSDGTEFALVRLVTDVRRNGDQWQRGVLDPFR